jgi:hypothetical protein
MVAGAVLHRLHTSRGIRWVLSNGTEVSHETAFDVRSDPRVIGIGDCLSGFGSELSQTFRFADEPA